MTEKTTNRIAAENGVKFGILLSVLAILSLISSKMPLLSIVQLALMIVVPIVIFKQLKARYIDSMGLIQSGTLWFQGLLTFFYGSLISSAVALVYLQVIEPNLIYDQVINAAKAYEQMGHETHNPQFIQFAKTFRQLANSGKLPSSFEITFMMFLICVTTGSICSLIEATIIRAIGFSKQIMERQAQNNSK